LQGGFDLGAPPLTIFYSFISFLYFLSFAWPFSGTWQAACSVAVELRQAIDL